MLKAALPTLAVSVLFTFAATNIFAEESLKNQAISAYQKGKRDDALKLLTQALAADPEDTGALTMRGSLYSQLNDHAKAAADYERAARLGKAAALRSAGAENFFAGKFDASIAAFDDYAQHFPAQAPQLWERGISLYYAKRYADGRKQFEEHRKVNPHDVENAAWHFICAAKESGIENARKNLIAIDTDKDTRVPMKQIYQLFKGEGKPDDVLAAATEGAPAPAELRSNLCYAHLYLGLYFEALGDEKKARDHIEKAAVEFSEDGYMGLTAQVHWAVMKEKK